MYGGDCFFLRRRGLLNNRFADDSDAMRVHIVLRSQPNRLRSGRIRNENTALYYADFHGSSSTPPPTELGLACIASNIQHDYISQKQIIFWVYRKNGLCRSADRFSFCIHYFTVTYLCSTCTPLSETVRTVPPFKSLSA